ncbi:helix-turn-helix transcriptional regulator [Azospirillum sp. RWY-5-1]|uniref:Helix-turn-helix transcriptional regulator n=1 Tax=Azospirillum oleiclasticum TaxID=2735135 RepID=A0ABX2TBL7_9PROT|nr:helix-turn-helix transcriptional regulator [Azospirillum oleiclasticum]NYZ13485.1 helix-turn-helix transcriptional regulator [Azospirillum oleiclasticum]NYZ20646.1 helix-turn-helix transcriptional regulator [Azospirillum oleiclasticum]
MFTKEEFIQWRRAKNFTQAGAAEHLGVSRRTVLNWEAGNSPVPDTIIKLIDALGELHLAKAVTMEETESNEGAGIMAIIKRVDSSKIEKTLGEYLSELAKKDNCIDAAFIVDFVNGGVIEENDYKEKTKMLNYEDIAAEIPSVIKAYKQFSESGIGGSSLRHIDIALEQVVMRVSPLSQPDLGVVFVNSNPATFVLTKFDRNSRIAVEEVDRLYKD